MVIRTIGEAYRIIRTLEGGRDILAYLGVCEGGDEGERFLLLKPLNKEVSGKILPYFMELMESQRVEALRGCFTKDGVVWVVFRYFEGCALEEAARMKLPLKERLKIARELTEQIFAQNLPVYLQYEASLSSNITVNASRGAVVNFLLSEPDKIGHDLFPAVQRHVAACFETLFERELKMKRQTQPFRFVNDLRGAAFTRDSDLFYAYLRMEEALSAGCGEGERRKRERFDRLRRGAWRWFLAVCRVLYVFLVGILIAVLIGVCRTGVRATGERKPFDFIGTLRVRGNADGPQGGEMETGGEVFEIWPRGRKTEEPGIVDREQETQREEEQIVPKETQTDTSAEMG